MKTAKSPASRGFLVSGRSLAPVHSRARTRTYWGAKQVPELLLKVEAYPGRPYARRALKWMVLTVVRTSELIGVR